MIKIFRKKNNLKEEAIKSKNWCRENIKLSIQELTNLPKERLDEKKLEELTKYFQNFIYIHLKKLGEANEMLTNYFAFTLKLIEYNY